MDQQQQQDTSNQIAKAQNARLNLISTAVLALAVLGFAAYLFHVGQGTVGATLAGAVVAHYFTAANGQQTTNSALTAVAAVGRLLAPPVPATTSTANDAAKTTPVPMSAGGTSTGQPG